MHSPWFFVITQFFSIFFFLVSFSPILLFVYDYSSPPLLKNNKKTKKKNIKSKLFLFLKPQLKKRPIKTLESSQIEELKRKIYPY